MLQIVKYVAMSQVLVDEEPRVPNGLGTDEGVQEGVVKVSPPDDILHKSLDLFVISEVFQDNFHTAFLPGGFVDNRILAFVNHFPALKLCLTGLKRGVI